MTLVNMTHKIYIYIYIYIYTHIANGLWETLGKITLAAEEEEIAVTF